jgi:hypothetical protein
MCDFIHVLIFVIVSKCQKSLKITNIVIYTNVHIYVIFFQIGTLRLLHCFLNNLRVTSHTILGARDHYTSSTLIGGKGGAGPSSLLDTTLEGPTEYVNARWM